MTEPHPIRLGYAANRLLRDGEARTDASLGEALAHPGARVYLSAKGQWLAQGDPERPGPGFSVAEARELLEAEEITLLLGHTAKGEPRLAAAIADARAEALTASDWPGAAPQRFAGVGAFDLRTLGMRQLLDPDTEGQLAQATHLLTWHAQTRFCGRCGASTVSEAAGLRRRCTRCDTLIFPRTDPVSIMLIHDGEGSCVLGRQPRFPVNSWSCLAGFIEAGETLEDAVRRETLEEAGLTVDKVTYHSSQPWPFPGSLMIGCIAEATSRDIAFDGLELEACRWFTRAEVTTMLAGTHPDGLVTPPPFAIAHHLIRAFVDGAAGED